MGYFANGFVFTVQPDYDAASKVVPGRLARGYKHNQHAIWLLDLWKPRGKMQLRNAPFCDPAVEEFRTDTAIDESTRGLLTALDGLRKAFDLGTGGLEIWGVHSALAVAAAARCPAFYFAADDNDTDMACNAVSGSLVTFGCRIAYLSVQYTGTKTTITPLNDFVDGDEQGLQDLITTANTVPGITVLEPKDVENGQVLYENPVGHWPKAAHNPAEILGLGTWHPLLNLENDFTVVFEKLNASSRGKGEPAAAPDGGA